MKKKNNSRNDLVLRPLAADKNAMLKIYGKNVSSQDLKRKSKIESLRKLFLFQSEVRRTEIYNQKLLTNKNWHRIRQRLFIITIHNFKPHLVNF